MKPPVRVNASLCNRERWILTQAETADAGAGADAGADADAGAHAHAHADSDPNPSANTNVPSWSLLYIPSVSLSLSLSLSLCLLVWDNRSFLIAVLLVVGVWVGMCCLLDWIVRISMDAASRLGLCVVVNARMRRKREKKSAQNHVDGCCIPYSGASSRNRNWREHCDGPDGMDPITLKETRKKNPKQP